MNPKFHHYFMDVAKRTAELSYARRLKVGSVAAFDKRIVACGYNGTPPGEDNNCETGLPMGGLKTKDNVLHSEVNLINFAKQEDISLWKCTLYITHRPCINCAKEVLDARFQTVLWDVDYGWTDGAEYLNDNGVLAVKLEDYLLAEYGVKNEMHR